MNISTRVPLQEQFDLLRTEYVTLLNDMDVLLQWGKPMLEAFYNTRIGYLQIEILQLQLRIKALKRKIELVHAAINQSNAVNVTEIELRVAIELAEAESGIMNAVTHLEHSKGLLSNLESPVRSAELRKLYKQLAIQLHPDVNDTLTGDQENLWRLVKYAYETGDLDKLKVIRIVYEKELNSAASKIAELSELEIAAKTGVLKHGIIVLHEQLLQIRQQFPFTIEVQLNDEVWVESQSAELKSVLDKLAHYERDLTLEYHQLISVL